MRHQRKSPRSGLTLLLAALFTGLVVPLNPAPVQAQEAVFGTALLADFEVPGDAYWTVSEPSFPYPRELARDGISGCLVAEMTVTRSGTSKDVTIIHSFPARGIDRAFKRTLNRIRWTPLDEDREAREEVRRVRVDFCASYASQEDARNQCAFSIQQPCQ